MGSVIGNDGLTPMQKYAVLPKFLLVYCNSGETV